MTHFKHNFFCIAVLIWAAMPLFAAKQKIAQQQVVRAQFEDLNYILDEKFHTAIVDVSPKQEGEIDIPEIIPINDEDYTVIGIGDKAFKGSKNLESISLPPSIKSVYRSAFEGTAFFKDTLNWNKGALYIDSILIAVDPDSCKTKYYIQPGTTVIAVGALIDCKTVTQVWIPESVEEIAAETFKNHKNLRKFHIGRGVKRIGKDAFYGTAAWDNEGNWKKGVLYIDTCIIAANAAIKPNCVIKPESRLIAAGAFLNNPTLRTINLPSRIKEIPDEAFCGCPDLKTITMPAHVSRIGRLAFADCQSIKSFAFPAELKEIGLQAFSGCIALQEIRLPKGVREIPDGTFFRCLALGRISQWPEQLKEIGTGAFRDCSQLLEVKKLPKTLKKIGDGCFAGCSSLQEVVMPDSLISVSAHLFDGCINLRECKLPEGVYDIDNYAFRGCLKLESFHMPDYLFRIGEYAFLGCSDLRYFRISDYTQVIETGAFMGCTGIEKLDLPLRTKNVEKQVFSGCKLLREINFHSDLKSIEEAAFEGCTLLKKVFVPEGTEIHPNAFGKDNKQTQINFVEVKK